MQWKKLIKFTVIAFCTALVASSSQRHLGRSWPRPTRLLITWSKCETRTSSENFTEVATNKQSASAVARSRKIRAGVPLVAASRHFIVHTGFSVLKVCFEWLFWPEEFLLRIGIFHWSHWEILPAASSFLHSFGSRRCWKVCIDKNTCSPSRFIVL